MGIKSQSRKKRFPDAPPDVISDLPRHVIDGIMERLPLKDAAKMSILSKKWRDIWISTPSLSFDARFFIYVPVWQRHVDHKYYDIVSKVLFQHEGPIFKFFLYVPPYSECPDVTQWISFLSRNGIKDFALQNGYKQGLKLSSHLLSCVGLERLHLRCCELSPPPGFSGFRKLLSLELVNVTMKEGIFENLVASWASLERLTIENCTGVEDIKFNAPSLRHLIIAGVFRSLRVGSCENLISASIFLETQEKMCHKASLKDLIEFLANSNKFKKLCCGGHFNKVLVTACLLVPPTFVNLRTFQLSCIHLDDLEDFSSAIRAIQSCPNVEMLDISVSTSNDLDLEMLDYNLNTTLKCLRCAKVSMYGAATVELKLIEFLLACSPALETLSLALIRKIDNWLHSRMSEQLIRFRRASPKVEVFRPDRNIPAHTSDIRSVLDSEDENLEDEDYEDDFIVESDASLSSVSSDTDFFMSSDSL